MTSKDPFWRVTPPTWEPSPDEYYSSKLVGSSALKRFRALRAAIIGPGPAPSVYMILGQMVDCLLTEPEEFDRRFALVENWVEPGESRHPNSKAYKAAKARVEAAGMRIVTEDLMLTAGAIKDGVLRNPLTAALFSSSPGQVAHRWTDEGVECRCRFDLLFHAGALGFGDLKCLSVNPYSWEEVARSIWKFEIDLQFALYERGFHDLWGELPEMILVVAGTKAPYVGEVAVWPMSLAVTDAARARVEQDLRDLARCRETGDYSQPGFGEVQPPRELPRWMKR